MKSAEGKNYNGMNIKTTVMIAALVLGVLPLGAQTKRAASTGGNSPHETTSAVIDGNRVTIVYGRPYTKNPKTGEARKIWGGLVAYGKVWRTGADEANASYHAKADLHRRHDRSRRRLLPLHIAQ